MSNTILVFSDPAVYDRNTQPSGTVGPHYRFSQHANTHREMLRTCCHDNNMRYLPVRIQGLAFNEGAKITVGVDKYANNMLQIVFTSWDAF